MNVLIGITGGISAYKIYDLIRLFVKNSDSVKVIITENAGRFVDSLVIETLSGNSCMSDMFAERNNIAHIELARWAELFIIAPATANIIGKISNGIADDLLSTSVISMKNVPTLIFPAMNSAMYENDIVQKNICKLRELGFFVSRPESGSLACGETGPGRLPHPEAIYRIAEAYFRKKFSDEPDDYLYGRKVMITAGATKAYLDPVRYVSNNASGRTGVELAIEMFLRGAEIYFITSKNVIEKFPVLKIIVNEISEVETTEDVYRKAEKKFDEMDIYISTAALSDFKNSPLENKIKKDKSGFKLDIPAGIDVFKELSKKKDRQLMVGFALETENLIDNAVKKMKEKNMDLIIANKSESINSGVTSATVIDKNGVNEKMDNLDKGIFAERLVRIIKGYLV
jgi:phosphopantothenoylcysteine decarboxylase / phosphopantothenate---cysteine ligase